MPSAWQSYSSQLWPRNPQGTRKRRRTRNTWRIACSNGIAKKLIVSCSNSSLNVKLLWHQFFACFPAFPFWWIFEVNYPLSFQNWWITQKNLDLCCQSVFFEDLQFGCVPNLRIISTFAYKMASARSLRVILSNFGWTNHLLTEVTKIWCIMDV